MFEQRATDFIQYLRFEKRYSQHTQVAYKKDLLQFSTYIDGQFNLKDIHDIALFHIRSWLASLKDEGQTARSINRKISTLSSFYKYLLKQQVVDKNIVRQVHALKLPERLPTFLKE